jgi:ketosteroid isomerase-like protein
VTDAEVVRRYLELSTAGDPAAHDLENSEIAFWVSGRLRMSGDLSVEQHRKAAGGIHKAFPGGYRLTIRSLVADGGRVAVEAAGEGVLPDGDLYQPSYAMFFTVEDGLITSMREYLDTEYVAATFKVPLKHA